MVSKGGLADLAKRIVGKLTKFHFTPGSGLETVEGVPIGVFYDPDGRSVVELFSSDGSRVFLYSQHMTHFITFEEAAQAEEVKEEKVGSIEIDMNDPKLLQQLQGQVTEYGTPLKEEKREEKKE